MYENKQIVRSVGVHDGVFHADDVTAVALLWIHDLIDLDKVVRTRDKRKLSCCEYVCDVGGELNHQTKRFDHHQKTYLGDRASAGLVLEYLVYKQIIPADIAEYLDRNYIWSIDLADNGKINISSGFVHVSAIVSAFVSVHPENTEEDLNKDFIAAVELVAGHIKRLIYRYLNIKRYILPIVRESMEKKDTLLLFDQNIDWGEAFFMSGGEDHPALFVIMPDKDANWVLRCIPTRLHGLESRMPLPSSWSGLFGEALSSESGISGGVFCHKNLFISIWESRAHAYDAYKQVMKQK